MNVVFDLDGTLADTEWLVRHSYELVGVKMPADAWGRPAHEWLEVVLDGEDDLDAAEIHRLKNVAMKTLLAARGAEALPASHLCSTLRKTKGYTTWILTGASYEAAVATRRSVGLSHVPFLGVSASLEDKISLLTGLAPTGIYFDDNYDACCSVGKRTGWVVCYISEDTNLDTLLEGFKEAEEMCKQ